MGLRKLVRSSWRRMDGQSIGKGGSENSWNFGPGTWTSCTYCLCSLPIIQAGLYVYMDYDLCHINCSLLAALFRLSSLA